jgi:hypothetical protein
MPSIRLDEPDRFVSKAEIRLHFNTMRLYQKAATGELVAIVRDEHLAPRAARQPAGTVTQMVIYYDDLQSGNLRPVALVHQYLQPDGKIGGSGRPDPKWLRLPDGTIIAATESS